MVTDPLALVREHVAAFNAADLDRVMAGFTDDAVFTSGEHQFVGAGGIRALFAEAFGGPVQASMELVSSVVEGDTAACELRERVEFQGGLLDFTIAAFYTVRDGRFARVKVYREGGQG